MTITAANWRFGASGGVARLKVSADLQVSALVRAAVPPRLRQAALTLAATRGLVSSQNMLTLFSTKNLSLWS